MFELKAKVEELGRQVESDLKRANADLRKLPEIAEWRLSNFDAVDGLALKNLVDFLEITNLPQQTKNLFSDLPVTVFRARDFYIELLLWSHVTKTIHQHGFGGAFRVVLGSSLHTRYQFRTDRRVNDDFLVGKVAALGSESLPLGSVRRIDPGFEGLVHSLYHLDNPSISLVVRDRGHSAFGPQYSYFPPALALHWRSLESDELVSMFSRLIDLTSKLDRALFRDLWRDRIAQLEFPRLAWLLLTHSSKLENEELEAFRHRAHAVHGDLIFPLLESVEESADQQLLVRIRERIHDPDLRFFVALLMNVPDRSDILKMVSERFPGHDPINCCAGWLARLSVDEQSAERRIKEVMQMIEAAGKGAMQFSRQLRRALPAGVDVASAEALFRQFIRGEGDASVTPGLSGVSLGGGASFMALAAIPQWAALRPSSSGA